MSPAALGAVWGLRLGPRSATWLARMGSPRTRAPHGVSSCLCVHISGCLLLSLASPSRGDGITQNCPTAVGTPESTIARTCKAPGSASAPCYSPSGNGNYCTYVVCAVVSMAACFPPCSPQSVAMKRTCTKSLRKFVLCAKRASAAAIVMVQSMSRRLRPLARDRYGLSPCSP